MNVGCFFDINLETFSPQAWLCCGDFNEILDESRKQGGATRSDTQMADFKNALEHCQLCDIVFFGSRYTWSNKRHDCYFTKQRLDRVVANIEFATKFPKLSVEVLTTRTSDHAPLFVSLLGWTDGHRSRQRIFRYEAWWQKKEGFPKIVKQVWKEKSHRGDLWGVLKEKLTNSQTAD
jgi:hypothetical protein